MMLWLVVLLVLSVGGSLSNSQLVVIQPASLAAEFPNGHIEGSTAVFGTPYYGERVAGNLLFFDKSGCEENDYHFELPKKHQPPPTPPVGTDDGGSARRRRTRRALSDYDYYNNNDNNLNQTNNNNKDIDGRVLQDNKALPTTTSDGTDTTEEETKQAGRHRGDGEGLRTVVMVRRGDCHFVTKAVVAEKKGATAVVIVDSEGSMSSAMDVKKIIMADDGWGDGVRIPSLLIGEIDGLLLINKLLKGERVIVELAWTVPKATPVQMDQWMSPAFADSNKFLQEFAPYAKSLKHKLDYHPHYVVITLPGDFKEMCTDDTGRFCGWDPDKGGKTTGKEVMEETVRQLCLWETTQKLNEDDPDSGFYSEQWWSYVEQILAECPHKGTADKDEKASKLLQMTVDEYEDKHTLGENCSYALMETVGANVNQVKKCYNHQFNSLLTRELVNKAWSSTAIMINSWRYSGPLDAEQLTRTLCTGYEEVPDECKQLFHPSRNELIRQGVVVERIEGGMALWSVVLVSLIAILIGILLAAVIYWYCLHPRIRSSMRYSIMDEARKNSNSNQQNNNNNIGGGGMYDIHNSGAPTDMPSSSPSIHSLSSLPPNVCGSPIGSAEPLGRKFSFEDDVVVGTKI
eukprot:GHVS01005698.1.p1 GENE.GHVS01005698.1~~GHVS01005698.1.p1  ORF type:complete len:629 (-),score=115.20 GHVS01005698.1:669-2555(-)